MYHKETYKLINKLIEIIKDNQNKKKHIISKGI